MEPSPRIPADIELRQSDGPPAILDLDPACRTIGNLSRKLVDELAASKQRHPTAWRTRHTTHQVLAGTATRRR